MQPRPNKVTMLHLTEGGRREVRMLRAFLTSLRITSSLCTIRAQKLDFVGIDSPWPPPPPWCPEEMHVPVNYFI